LLHSRIQSRKESSVCSTVTFLDYPDYNLNPLGARGGVAPAIANAVYHATGVRVRKLPIRVEDLHTVRGRRCRWPADGQNAKEWKSG
jgi:hypothetical protein